MMVQTFNLSSLEAEAGESGIQSPPWLHSNFDASLGYMRPCLQKKKKKSLEKSLSPQVKREPGKAIGCH